MKIENFTVYHLSDRSRVVIRADSESITIFKRVNQMMESQVRLNGEELAKLISIVNMKHATDEALGIDAIEKDKIKKDKKENAE